MPLPVEHLLDPLLICRCVTYMGDESSTRGLERYRELFLVPFDFECGSLTGLSVSITPSDKLVSNFQASRLRIAARLYPHDFRAH